MKKNGLKLTIVAVILVWIIVSLAVMWGEGGINDIVNAQKKEDDLKSETMKIEDDIKNLQKEIEELKTSSSKYEIIAREKLYMKKKGEIVVYVKENEPQK